jgi:D-glycero-D-manno-heptose 1,7-bisphosphate phosphatase
MKQSQRTIFLDRDGTLNEDIGYLSRPEDLHIFPFVKEALYLLKSNGYGLIVVTNQSGIGRGIYDENALNAIHERMQFELDNMIDAFYFCPHLPEAGCGCRKPNLGMIELATRDRPIDMAGSWMVGDKELDVEMGLKAGVKTVLVETGYGRAHAAILNRQPEQITSNVLDAAKYITAQF